MGGRGEVAEAGATALEGKTQRRLRGRRADERRVVGLGEVDEAGVVAEVGVAQLGMTIETQAAGSEPVELASQEVGQVERARLLVRSSAYVAAPA